jgi:hypothetical protein
MEAGALVAFASSPRGAASLPSPHPPSPPPPPPPPSPPDCRRYWALWNPEEGASRRRRDHDRGPVSEGGKERLDRARVDQWNDELDLARYNAHKRARIDGVVQQENDGAGGWVREKRARELELDMVTILPRVMGRDERFWNALPDRVKHDPKFAWVLLQTKNALSLPFQKMLWMDPSCPLRTVRRILLASLDRGLDNEVIIHWSDDLASDRALVLRCVSMCPECLTFGGEAGLPLTYLEDVDVARAFFFSPEKRIREFRTSVRTEYHERSGIPERFSKALFDHPGLMADLLIRTSDSAHEGETWAHIFVFRAFRTGGKPCQRSLLHDADFVRTFARGVADIPDSHRRRWLTIQYHKLPSRLMETPEVALAFVQLRGANISHVPLALKCDAAFGSKLWKVATDNYPAAVYDDCFDANQCPDLLSSKSLALRLLAWSTSTEDALSRLHDFAKFFRDCSAAVTLDREVNAQMVLSCATVMSTALSVASVWVQNRDFWIDLAAQYKCPCFGWRFVSDSLATDDGVILAWGRHACPDGSIDWLDTFRSLLSDRQVVSNWIPELCRDDRRATILLRQILPEIFADKALWLDQFSRRDADVREYMTCLPETLRTDRDIVEAQLRLNVTHPELFLQRFTELTPELQQQFVPLLVEAIESSRDSSFVSVWGWALAPEHLSFPDVALAAIAKGWGPGCTWFSRVVEACPWSNDPEFLLRVAKVHRRRYSFRRFCPDALCHDKAFVLRVLKLDGGPWIDIGDDELENDFDVMFAKFLPSDLRPGNHWWKPSDREREFVATVRSRLVDYLALEMFLWGVSSRPRSAARIQDDDVRSRTRPPLTLLGQDCYTLDGLTNRLAEYLGSASSHEEAARLRRVSNEFTKYGY